MCMEEEALVSWVWSHKWFMKLEDMYLGMLLKSLISSLQLFAPSVLNDLTLLCDLPLSCFAFSVRIIPRTLMDKEVGLNFFFCLNEY